MNNLYRDIDGSKRLGAYITMKPDKRYNASIKFHNGYTKAKLFYTYEEAHAWIDENYESVRAGYYDDPIEGIVALRYYGTKMNR